MFGGNFAFVGASDVPLFLFIIHLDRSSAHVKRRPALSLHVLLALRREADVVKARTLDWQQVPRVAHSDVDVLLEIKGLQEVTDQLVVLGLGKFGSLVGCIDGHACRVPCRRNVFGRPNHDAGASACVPSRRGVLHFLCLVFVLIYNFMWGVRQ